MKYRCTCTPVTQCHYDETFVVAAIPRALQPTDSADRTAVNLSTHGKAKEGCVVLIPVSGDGGKQQQPATQMDVH